MAILTVNEIILQNTMVDNGTHRIYPTFDKLLCIVEGICRLHKTAEEYVRITPFYKNAKENLKMWHEFEEYMFFIEFRDFVSDIDRKKFMEEDCSQEIPREHPEKLLFLCERGDTVFFAHSLNTYMNYLVEDALIKMHEEAAKQVENKEYLPFGYIGFEIHCD